MKTAHWIGPLAAGTLAIACVSLGACSRDSKPETWVDRLDQPARRAEAVTHLTEIYDEAMTKAAQHREDPAVQAVDDVMVEPVAKRYMDDSFDEPAAKDAVLLLARTLDFRAAGALAKALDQHLPGKDDDQALAVTRAVREMVKTGRSVGPTLTKAVFGCFAQVHTKVADPPALIKELAGAVSEVRGAKYGDGCAEVLSRAVTADLPKPVVEEIFARDRTCMPLVKELKPVSAVRALVEMILVPEKKPVAGEAAAAVTWMPAAASIPLTRAITGTDAVLAPVELHWEHRGYIHALAPAVGWLGTGMAAEAALAALNVTDNDENRVALVRTLGLYPASPRLSAALMDTYKRIPAGLNEPEAGGNPHVPLLAEAPSLFDATLTAWLVKQVASAKGDEQSAIAPTALRSAMTLMGPEDLASVKAAVSKYGKPEESSELDKLAALTQKCAKDASCYVKALDEPIPATPPGANVLAIKAATMAAVYGDNATKQELVKRVATLTDGRTRDLVARAAVHLSPVGDADTASALEKVAHSIEVAAPAAADTLERLALILRNRVDEAARAEVLKPPSFEKRPSSSH